MAEVQFEASFVTAYLEKALGIHGGSQIFLFGPEGEPFWAARIPITEAEIGRLGEAIDLIEEVEEGSTRPFVAHDPAHRYTVGAFSPEIDLYVVVLDIDPNRVAAEARLISIREDLVPVARDVRQQLSANA